MSVRAIAAATGHSKNTINDDVRQVSQFGTPDEDERDLQLAEERAARDNGERIPLAEALAELGIDETDLDDEDEPEQIPAPRPVIGTDGKRYTQPTRPTTAPRAPLPQQFQTTAHELTRVIGKFERLQGDDRYRSNRPAIATQCLPEVRRAAEVLQALLSDLEQ